MTDLLPCPICGAAMVASPDPGFHDHPPTAWCILGHMTVAPDEVGAWNRRDAPQWQPIATAPHEELIVLAWFEGDVWKQEIALASAGERFPNGYSNRWIHGRATHWMPLPAPPVDSSAAPSTPVDNKISADPVGKEG